MKKNINVNMFGTIYAFDEDAYQLLQNYLQNMKSYFGKQAGGEEIADDIEHRIAELLWERKEAGATTVEIEAIRQILDELGDPEQMGAQEANVPVVSDGESSEERQEEEARKSDESGSGVYGEQKTAAPHRRLYRDENDKVIAGVLSGLTHYFGWTEPMLLRLLFLVFFFITVGYAVLFYVILWICMRPARTAEERLEMHGKAVNPESIKEEVLKEDANGKVPANGSSHNGCFRGALWGCGCLMALLFLPVLFVVVVTFLSALLGVGGGLMGALFGGIGGLMGGIGALIGGIGSLIGGIFGDGAHLFSHLNPNVSYTVTRTMGCPTSWDALSESGDTIHLFDALVIKGVGEVTYEPADTCGLWIEAYEEEGSVRPYQFYIQEGVLHIEPKSHFEDQRNNYTFHVTAPTLRDIQMEGAGEFRCLGEITGSRVNFKIAGIGSAELQVHTDSLYVDAEGVGTVEISGQTHYYDTKVSGIGEIDDDELERI